MGGSCAFCFHSYAIPPALACFWECNGMSLTLVTCWKESMCRHQARGSCLLFCCTGLHMCKAKRYLITNYFRYTIFESKLRVNLCLLVHELPVIQDLIHLLSMLPLKWHQELIWLINSISQWPEQCWGSIVCFTFWCVSRLCHVHPLCFYINFQH